MAGKNDVTISLDLDDRKAQQNLKKLSKEVRGLDDDFEDAESAGKALARAIEQSADDMIDEIDATARAVEAMEKQLDGVDLDPRQVVADLKKIGLTADDVEADAEALADALRKADGVKIHAAEAGFKDLSQAVGDVDGDIGRTGDTMSGFVAGSVGELPLISEQMGPLSEGLGQLTEGALNGEVAMKGLVAAGLGMGALTLAMQGINGHFEAQAAIDAFNAEQVEEYTEALEGADSQLEGIVEKLTDAAGVQINLFGEAIDITGEIVDAGLNVETFGKLLEEGEETWDAWAESARGAGVEAGTVDAVLAGLRSEAKALDAATAAAAITNEFLGDTVDDVADSSEDATRQLDDQETSVDDLSRRILEYVTAVEDIPAEAVSDIYALIDEGNLTEAERRLTDLERDRTANLRVRVTQEGQVILPGGLRAMDSGGVIPSGSAALVAERRPEIVNGELVMSPAVVEGPATVTSGQATAGHLGGNRATQNVTINVPHGYRPNDIVDLERRYRRRTGR
jgi:uncharacterized protein Yka (UPF0111/DUF47 family)